MQKRWFCFNCKREWAHGTDLDRCRVFDVTGQSVFWEPQHGCPCCRSSNIDEILFSPWFPGGDIHRDEHGLPMPSEAKAHTASPPMPLALTQPIAGEADNRLPPEPSPSMDLWQMI